MSLDREEIARARHAKAAAKLKAKRVEIDRKLASDLRKIEEQRRLGATKGTHIQDVKQTARERRETAYNLRKDGFTFKDIGKKLGVGIQRASMLVSDWERELRSEANPSIFSGLSVRARNCLGHDIHFKSSGIISEHIFNIPIDKQVEALKSYAALVSIDDLRKIPNCGQSTIVEILALFERHGLKPREM
jgi:hypothetical protein